MAKVIVALVLALVCAQERPGQDKPGQPGQDRPGQPGVERGANQELDQALMKAGQMNNYTANITLRKEGMSSDPGLERDGREQGPGGRDPGGKEPGRDTNLANQTIEYRVIQGQPYFLKAGALEGYRKGETFIVKEGGSWKKIDVDMSKVDKDEKQISANKLAMIRPPHEVLRDLKSSSFKSVRREDSEGGRVFSGELNEQALRQILSHNKKSDKTGTDQDKSAVQGTGNAKIWLGRDGNVSKFELVCDHKATGDKPAGNVETGKINKTIEFRDIGSTKYEVPADAQKLLGGTMDKPMDRGDKPTDRPTDRPGDKPNDDRNKDKDENKDNY